MRQHRSTTLVWLYRDICLFSQFSRSLVNLTSEEHWTNRCRPRLLLVVNLVTRGRVPQMSTDPKAMAWGAPINPDKSLPKKPLIVSSTT